MITFKELQNKIDEARKNPDLNPKISAYEFLYPYRNDDNAFISFMMTNKIGIKPSATYDETPLGIYCYPLKEIWKAYRIDDKKSFRVLPYAGDMEYVKLIKWNGKGKFIQDLYKTYTDVEFNNDMKNLRKVYKNKTNSNIDDAYNELIDLIKIYGGKITSDIKKGSLIHVSGIQFKSVDYESIGYNKIITELKPLERKYNLCVFPLEEIIKKVYDDTRQSDISNPYMFLKITKWVSNFGADPSIDEFFRGTYHAPSKSNLQDSSEKLPNMKMTYDYIRRWNLLLRELGYVGIADRSGKGLIHKNEPIQAVFLSSEFVKEVDTFLNKDYKKIVRESYEESRKYIEELEGLNSLTFSTKHLEKIYEHEESTIKISNAMHSENTLKRLLNKL
jgi:hypothetical protein